MNACIEKVTELVKEIVEPRLRDQVTPEEHLLGGKLIDSFGLIRLVVELEQAFGIAIRTEDMTVQSFNSVNSIVALVERCRAGGA
jgi:methoxymalonate biosynthesis acyl carrier protein